MHEGLTWFTAQLQISSQFVVAMGSGLEIVTDTSVQGEYQYTVPNFFPWCKMRENREIFISCVTATMLISLPRCSRCSLNFNL